MRAFASASVQRVEPEQAFKELNDGNGVLIDLRQSNGDVLLHKEAVSFPYEAIIGSDGGVDEVAGVFKREQLLEMIPEEKLGLAQYHANGQRALEVVRAKAGDPKMTVAKAQEWIKVFVKRLNEPKELAKVMAAQLEGELAADLEAVKKQFASGKVEPKIDARVTKWREDFKRYLALNPSTKTRFQKGDTTEQALKDQRFADNFLGEMRMVYGESATHEDVLKNLAKRKIADVVKDNKTFVTGAYLDFMAAYNKTKVKHHAEQVSALSAHDMEGLSSVITAHSEPWRSFLAYKEKPSKEELASSENQASLMRLAGLSHANIGAHAEKSLAAMAKTALSSLPKARPLFLVCTASQQSERVAAALASAGAGDVRVVDGGADRWLLRDVPTAPKANIVQLQTERVNALVGDKRSAIADINE